MKYFLLLILSTQCLFGQENLKSIKSLLSEPGNIDSIQANFLQKTEFEELTIYTQWELKRTMDFGFTHYRMEVMIDLEDYTLNAFSKDEKVMFGWISGMDQIGDKRKFVTLNIHDSTLPIQYYVDLHNQFYGTNLTTKDFEKQMTKEYTVGFGCGEAGQDIPKASKKAKIYYEQKNAKQLNKLLTSFSPELQTLGTIGLMKSELFDANSTRIVNHLKKRNSVIYSCSGCLYGIGETYNERIEYYQK